MMLKSAVLCLLVGVCFAQQQARSYNQRQQNPNYVQQNSYTQPQQQHYGSGCPERNGRFPVPSQCDAYIECEDGVATEKLCPDGLLFNAKARFNYPCGYPIDVECEARSALQPAQPTQECPHQYGYFRLGDQSHCGQFKNCAEGRGYVFDCPEGLAWNPATYQCDWPDLVADCDAEAFLGFRCPNSGIKSDLPSEPKFYKSPNDCQKYFLCVNDKPRLQNCGAGNAFSELIGACDAAENVTGCAHLAIQKDVPIKLDFDVRYQGNQQQNNYNQQQNNYYRPRG